MLRQTHEDGLSSQAAALQYLGKTFRVKLNLPVWYTDAAVGELLAHVDIDVFQDGFNVLRFLEQLSGKQQGA
jgi:hypothetical protein